MTILKNILLDGRKADIYIDDGKVSRICYARKKRPELERDAEIIDCTSCAAVPAFVNAHIHAAMSIMRGIAEDMVFSKWIEKIWDVESLIDGDFIRWGTKTACLEMLRTGTVTFNDHYWYSPTAHAAALEMGMNPVVSYVVLDRNDPEEAEREKEQFLKFYEEASKWGERSFAAAFHSIYSVSEQMVVWTSEFAKKHGLRLHFHLSETEKEVNDCVAKTGLSPVQYLDRLGVLDSNCIAAHTLWLSDDDIRTLGEKKVNCVHNINANLKLSSGYKFKYKELRDAGANVCIGTDGCASSNNLDILEALKTAAMVQKAWRGDPAAMPLNELIEMATVNGAKALGLNTGVIKQGAPADLLIIDTDSSFFLSDAPFLANFIYSSHSDCIRSVLHNGQFLMRDRKIEGEREILDRTREVLKKFNKKRAAGK
ncbi:MAG: amidohydrolase [Bacteroidales bacterium]|nr:amidohydrolase [Bacteroidales bacterium]